MPLFNPFYCFTNRPPTTPNSEPATLARCMRAVHSMNGPIHNINTNPAALCTKHYDIPPNIAILFQYAFGSVLFLIFSEIHL